jgi:diguanylate cyclase (GGDEF)-like protein/hemerythrin-like metal-binding protein
MIAWNDGLSVGVEVLDNDHKKLLKIINNLSNAIDENMSKEILSGIFADLEEYTVIHFSREESYIKKCNKEGFRAHKTQHDMFVAKIPELKTNLLNSSSYMSAQEITVFLTDWLVNHIISEDIPLIYDFEKCGVSQKGKHEAPTFKKLIKKATDTVSFDKRILLSILLPVVGMLFFGFIILWENFQKYNEISSTSAITQLIVNINKLAHSIQLERGFSCGYLASKQTDFDSKLLEQRVIVDKLIKAFALENSNTLLPIDANIKVFKENIVDLKNIRKRVDENSIARPEVMKFYSAMIANILSTTSKLSFLSLDKNISASIATLSSVLQYKESLGIERACVIALIENKNITNQEYINFSQLSGRQKTYLSLFEQIASPNQISLKEQILNTQTAKEIRTIEEQIKNRNFEKLDSKLWFELMSKHMNSVKIFEDTLLGEITNSIDNRMQETIHQFILLLVFLMLFLSITLFVIYLFKKSTIKQIHQLTNAMSHLADGGRSLRLPHAGIKDDITNMFDAYETTRQELLKGDIFTHLYQNQKEMELKNQQREKTKLEEMAFYDQLTGMTNRHKFEELSTLEIKHSKRYNHSLSFLMLDIDHFKNINDKYGHAVGDEVLKHFAAICKNRVREVDIVARIGGEEFVIVLPETNVHGAYQFSERLRVEVFNSHFIVDNETIQYSVSIGISDFEADINTKTILQRADQALYNAKQNGRNCTRVYKKSTSLT